MEEKNILQINFGSFIKLCVSIVLSLGVLLGLVMFMMSLFGAEVTATLGTMDLRGIPAGIAAIFIAPLLGTLFGLIFAVVAFLPFKLFLKLTKGLKMHLKFE